ncbi:MAG: methylmalonyl Co-A mutase-associated GTPase MeaB [Bacteroidales bacterium]|nr:methylmalonyl Co-A mutase-associated GTPase MeaB [Bacteroidales bacterium]
MPEKKKKAESALKVNKGIEQPSSINEDAVKKIRVKKITELQTDEIVAGVLSGNRTILSKAITLVESTLPAHHNLAQEVIEKCLPHSGKSIRIGITGVPGVGKSTFIESLGTFLIKKGKKIAVLAIDPSSARSKGSILGDKTRMENLANNKNAFVRPSASAGSLGGVARKTHESIILCEAAGYDTVFVETVGVGQSETAVHSMVDFFLLLMLAGAGDELQGIKRGIMEMADAIVINKADGDNIIKAGLAKRNYENALHLFPPTESGWIPLVKTCSSLSGDGIQKVWEIIENYIGQTYKNNYFNINRKNQSVKIMFDTINLKLNDSFYFNDEIEKLLPKIEEELKTNKISSYVAAQKLLERYFESLKRKVE